MTLTTREEYTGTLRHVRGLLVQDEFPSCKRAGGGKIVVLGLGVRAAVNVQGGVLSVGFARIIIQQGGVVSSKKWLGVGWYSFWI